MINISNTYATITDDRTVSTSTDTERIGYCGTGDSCSTTGKLLLSCPTALITLVLEQDTAYSIDDIIKYVVRTCHDEEFEILYEQLLKERSQKILLPDPDLILTTERHKEKDLISLSR